MAIRQFTEFLKLPNSKLANLIKVNTCAYDAEHSDHQINTTLRVVSPTLMFIKISCYTV